MPKNSGINNAIGKITPKLSYCGIGNITNFSFELSYTVLVI